MSFILRAEVVSDIGLVRSNNEDSAHAGPRLLALADGIGGMPAGELASDIAVRTLAGVDDTTPSDGALAVLREAADVANREILRVSASDPANDGMGTTATAVLLAGNQLAVLHVGDSRAYMQRDGQLSQLTKDDTFVQTLVDQGLLTAEQARHHPRRSVVTQALQGFGYEPTLTLQPAKSGDRLLLCSDGLSDIVTDDVIGQTLRSFTDLKQCADQLIKLALDGGSTDNVTVVVADILSEDAVPAG
jgi:serine/threonine protein phosphatase PrpC